MKSHKKFTFEGALTEEQINFINTHGFIHIENYSSQQIADEIRIRTESVRKQSVITSVKKIKDISIQMFYN